MSYEDLNSEDVAEIMRKKYRYQQLILSGKIAIPHHRAAQLLGPDCLYHLYSIREVESLILCAAKTSTLKRGASRRR